MINWRPRNEDLVCLNENGHHIENEKNEVFSVSGRARNQIQNSLGISRVNVREFNRRLPMRAFKMHPFDAFESKKRCPHWC